MNSPLSQLQPIVTALPPATWDRTTVPLGVRSTFSSRRLFLAETGLAALLLCGCNALSFRSQSPEDEATTEANERKLVGDVAVPFGMFPIRLEAVGLVTQLPGTGSDPPPSPERARLLAEMETLGVKNPNQILALPTTDLVLIRGYLRPGIQKGDHFDLEVRVPTRSENAGLRGGWLMETRLTELQAAGGQYRGGSLSAMAEGPILVDPTVDAKTDRVAAGRGRVLGGGVSRIARPLGLVLKPRFRNVGISSLTGVAINRRFHTYEKGIKTGVAVPKTDQYIELKVHPRYKDNVERFVRVIRCVPMKESAEEQLSRLAVLERNLLDPITSASAALKLEAIGKDSIPILKKGLVSTDVEVRFYAAEALAYLDEPTAAPELGRIAAEQPAFRAFALAAMGAMDGYESFDALKELLGVQSAETRYGAFRALWAMNRRDPIIRDVGVTDQFHYHVLDVTGPQMVHFTRNMRPEIVLFGKGQKLLPPVRIEAGPRILVNSMDGDRLSVSAFEVGMPDQKRIISSDVDEMIRAIAELGGTYPDVVQALQQAKATKSLEGRLEIEAVPQAGREFERSVELADDEQLSPEEEAQAAATVGVEVGTPVPDLFKTDKKTPKSSREDAAVPEENPAEDEPKPGLWRRLWGKMAGS